MNDPKDPSPVAGRRVSATGVNGQVTLDGDRLTIRKGLVRRSYGVRGDRDVPLRDLTAVRLRPATRSANGALELVVDRNGSRNGSPTAPPTGEYTLSFTEESAARFEQVRAGIQALLDAREQAHRR